MTKASEKEKKSQEKRCVIFLNIIVSKYFPDIKKFKDIQDVQERKTSILNTFYGGIDWYILEDELDYCLEEYQKKTSRYKWTADDRENEFWGLRMNFAPVFNDGKIEE